ncbi:hypothetical protein, partial [Undibacterium sp.]|uniref:hypothetical protein n=1 Tax=Undibacterium sp. TaxID=1914977 RepID=UPI002D7E553A
MFFSLAWIPVDYLSDTAFVAQPGVYRTGVAVGYARISGKSLPVLTLLNSGLRFLCGCVRAPWP